MTSLKSHPNRLLFEHSQGVYRLMIEEIRNTEKFIDFENFFGINYHELNLLVKSIAYLHDLGKASKYFQDRLNGKSVSRELSQHAILGSVALGNFLDGKIDDKKGAAILIGMAVIRYHHGKAKPLISLLTICDEQEVIRKITTALDISYMRWLSGILGEEVDLNVMHLARRIILWQKSLRKAKEAGIKPYMLFMYLFSLLSWADRTDAAFLGAYNFTRKELAANLVDIYREKKGFNNPKTKMDLIRNKFYRKSVSDLDFKIATIKGRTGIGKTLSVLSLALKKREEVKKIEGYTPRITYCLPFLSIIDQTYKTISDVLEMSGIEPSSDILIQQHHLTDLSYTSRRDSEIEDYKSYMADILLNSWDSEITLTTFVSLFHAILTDKRNLRFFRIPGSIIILDEIQAVSPKYWKVISEVLNHLSKYAGVTIIFSSATVPQPFLLSSKELIKDNYELDRYDIEYFGEMSIEEFKVSVLKKYLRKAIEEEKSLMIVMNTIKSCKDLFNCLKEELELEEENLYCLSSNIPNAVRKKVIQEIKGKKGFYILVTTQLIEAGVDLSFDYCIRDLGPLDSILQVAGRVNRSSEKTRGKLVIVELLKEDSKRPFSWIYDSTIIWATKQIMDKQNWNEPEIYALSDRYFSELEKKGLENESLDLLEALKKLDFHKISEFSLIEQIKGSLNLPVFLEIDENAENVWDEYCKILSENVDEAKKYEYLARRKQVIRALAPYVVNLKIYTYPGADNYFLPDIQNGFCYISSDELERYYDKKTGLNPEGDNFYCD